MNPLVLIGLAAGILFALSGRRSVFDSDTVTGPNGTARWEVVAERQPGGVILYRGIVQIEGGQRFETDLFSNPSYAAGEAQNVARGAVG